MAGRDLLAKPEDGQEILRVLESAPAQGCIELLYTRRPDAYLSYQRECGESRVFISKKEGRIVGSCAELIREVYIGGVPARAAYLCGLKKDAEHDGPVGFGPSLFRSLVREDIDCYFFSVVDDNIKAQRMFEKKSRMMETCFLQDYTTYILTSRLALRTRVVDYDFRQATKQDETAILEFLCREGKKKDLFPVMTSLDKFYDLRIEDFYLLEVNGEIAATAALWNQTAYKQYVVKKYKGFLKYARLFNPILSLLGYIKLPKENQSLVVPMLSFFLSRDDNMDYYTAFLNHISHEIAKKYDMYAIGVPRNSFSAKIFDCLPSVRLKSKIYMVRFLSCNVKKIDRNRIYPECGLL